MTPGSIRRRLDIDGLRAIAVIPVILYHPRILQVPGGFVGVDIFFVISGYHTAGPDGGVGHLDCVGYAFSFPRDAKDYGVSLVATLFFFSNAVFSRQTGYFDTAAEMKRLLHTWSMAVEEQFYILCPLFLFRVSRYFRKYQRERATNPRRTNPQLPAHSFRGVDFVLALFVALGHSGFRQIFGRSPSYPL